MLRLTEVRPNILIMTMNLKVLNFSIRSKLQVCIKNPDNLVTGSTTKIKYYGNGKSKQKANVYQ